jgi:3-oxoacyl-[acyl-carrier-protein] synthase II
MKWRVVVTGLGLLSCLGNDPESFFQSLIDGVSGITPHPDIPKYPVGWVAFNPEVHFSKTELLSLDRVSQFALITTRQAVAMASLNANDIERAGILYGTGFG